MTFQGEGFNAVGTRFEGKCVITNVACVTSTLIRKKFGQFFCLLFNLRAATIRKKGSLHVRERFLWRLSQTFASVFVGVCRQKGVITRLFRLSIFAFMRSKAHGCSVFLPSSKVSCIRFNAHQAPAWL